MYTVKLSIKDKNDDYQYLDIDVKSSDDNMALKKAIDYYYKNYWSNTEWRKDEFDAEMINVKSKLKDLSNDLLLKRLPNFDIIINEYEQELRKKLGSTDKSLVEFEQLDIQAKIDYLLDIGCELSYFVYHKKAKFEKVSI